MSSRPVHTEAPLLICGGGAVRQGGAPEAAPLLRLRVVGRAPGRAARPVAAPVDDLTARPYGDVALPAGEGADRLPGPSVGDAVRGPDGRRDPDRRCRLAGPGFGVAHRGVEQRRAGRRLVEVQPVVGPVRGPAP